MAIFRVYKESGNFVTVNKDFIHDPNLSWKAKGILLYLLSRPDDWQIYETELKSTLATVEIACGLVLKSWKK